MRFNKDDPHEYAEEAVAPQLMKKMLGRDYCSSSDVVKHVLLYLLQLFFRVIFE